MSLRSLWLCFTRSHSDPRVLNSKERLFISEVIKVEKEHKIHVIMETMGIPPVSKTCQINPELVLEQDVTSKHLLLTWENGQRKSIGSLIGKNCRGWGIQIKSCIIYIASYIVPLISSIFHMFLIPSMTMQLGRLSLSSCPFPQKHWDVSTRMAGSNPSAQHESWYSTGPKSNTDKDA